MPRFTAYENSLLTLRFDGDSIGSSGVSIYDLSCSLLSVQRIYHKSFLAMHSRLDFRSFPNKEERNTLALTIGQRKRASDGFGLIPILNDQPTQELLKQVTEFAITGMIGYFIGDVLDRIRKETDLNKKLLIGSIYPEIASLASRIDAAGGVNSIQVGAPLLDLPVFCDFTPATKDYLKSLQERYYLGELTTIKGHVYKFYPNSQWVGIRVEQGTIIDVLLKDSDFDQIRYKTSKNPLVSFYGKPRYKFNVATKSIQTFEADSIQLLAES